MRPPRLIAVVLATLALTGAGILTSPTALAFNYVQNGDFESGSSAWSVPGSAVLDAVDGTPSGRIGFVGRVTLASSSSSIRQSSFAGTPAGQYHFSASLWMSSASMVVYAQVSSNPSTANVRFDAPQVAGEWVEVSGLVDVIGFTNISFTIGASGSPGDQVLVDDVRFDGADPATMTPTNTPIPPTSSHTPLPPTGTRTPKPTNTPKPTSTSTTLAETSMAGTSGEGTTSGVSAFLANGGFEEAEAGSPIAWEKYGGSLSSATSPVRSGSYAARFESTTESTKWLFQTVHVTPGQAYAFDAWLLHNDPGIASAFLRISWYESTDGSGTALGTADSTTRLDGPAGEWRHLTTGAVAAPPQAASAKIRVMLQPVSAGRAALYVDDASFSLSSAPVVAAAAAGLPSEDSRASVAGSTSRAGSTRTGTHQSSVAPAGNDVTIVINEVLYDSMANPDGAGEWIEFYNPGERPVSLEGWYVADNTTSDVIDHLTVPARGFAILAGAGFRAEYPDYVGAVETVRGSIGNSLGNEGDVVVLVAPNGRFVDAVSWGSDAAALDPAVTDVPEGHSIERLVPGGDSDAAEDFVDNESPSPGAAYIAPRTSAQQVGNDARVQIVSGDSGASFAWLPWVLAAGSMAALAGVASWRLLPSLAERMRHS